MNEIKQDTKKENKRDFDKEFEVAKKKYNRGHKLWHFFALTYVGRKNHSISFIKTKVITVYYCSICKKEIVK